MPPESIGHGSVHVARIHHHRHRVHQQRAQIDQAARETAAGRYAPDTTTQPPSAPLEDENGDHHVDH